MDYDEIVERVYAATPNSMREMPKPEKAELLEALKYHLLECHTLLEQLVSDDARASSYWLAHLRCTLDHDHMYVDRSATIQDTIDEYNEWEGDEGDPDYGNGPDPYLS